MKNNTRWIIVDTETDGLFAPIHIVEIAAQAMVGWEPAGKPFQVFLNHNIRIPAAATAVHGYTSDFLAQNGKDPAEAHAMFADYAAGDPLVCHNLGYDWDRALVPEWNRLGIQAAGCPGFCSMLLSRRVIWETKKHNLDLLKAHFKIDSGRSHQAGADVETVVRIFTSVIGPRLSAAGIDSFQQIRTFSRKSPIKKCREIIEDKTEYFER
jgi:DNA polymerase III epsilon subunit-like protein